MSRGPAFTPRAPKSLTSLAAIRGVRREFAGMNDVKNIMIMRNWTIKGHIYTGKWAKREAMSSGEREVLPRTRLSRAAQPAPMYIVWSVELSP